jgi:preprotein translocase subunit SecG
MLILAKMDGVQLFLSLLLIAVCVMMMAIILVQRGRGGGLSAAIGGGGGGSSVFGAKTGDRFTLFTVVLAAVYLLIAVAGNYVFHPDEPETSPPNRVQAPDPGGTTPPAGRVPSQPLPARAPVAPPTGGGDAAAGGQTAPVDQPITDEPVGDEEPSAPDETTP